MLKIYFHNHEALLKSTVMNGTWYNNEKKKLTDIRDAEVAGEEIIAIGNVWIYETAPLPGDDEKPNMPAKMIRETNKDLQEIMDQLDDARMEENDVKLTRGITRGKTFMKKIEPILEGFQNGDEVRKHFKKIEKSVKYAEIEAECIKKRKEKRK